MTIKKGIGYAIICILVFGYFYFQAQMFGWRVALEAFGTLVGSAGIVILVVWLLDDDKVSPKQQP
jgi:hypothetical protein